VGKLKLVEEAEVPGRFNPASLEAKPTDRMMMCTMRQIFGDSVQRSKLIG